MAKRRQVKITVRLRLGHVGSPLQREHLARVVGTQPDQTPHKSQSPTRHAAHPCAQLQREPGPVAVAAALAIRRLSASSRKKKRSSSALDDAPDVTAVRRRSLAARLRERDAAR